ncbi:MAG: NYN domain-containing protein [Treponema sp.]|nr:NYN domain-containing protein [Treponema sp.]
MAARKKTVLKIGIFYDGHYFYKASNYYKFDHIRQARISVSGLHSFICNEVSVKQNVDIELCKIVEAHYFRGRAIKSGNEKAIVGERYFEDALTREGVNLHYLPLIRSANNELKEKGIDVSLSLTAYKKAASKAFDVFVLIAGDGDYLPLVRELQAMGSTPIDVMLLSWDFECANGDVTITSQDLLEEVKYPLQMASIIDDRLNLKNPVITGLFEPRQIEPPSAPAMPLNTSLGAEPRSLPPSIPTTIPGISPLGVGAVSPFAPPAPLYATKRKALTEAEMAQERISTILSLNDSGGWIRDVEYNNFYFFYTDVVNKQPEELAIGMTLQFHLRYDKIKSEQKDGEPSYRAVGPIYAVD